MKAPRDISHDEVVIGMLKADPDFANEYLAAALEEADLPGGARLHCWRRFAILQRPRA